MTWRRAGRVVRIAAAVIVAGALGAAAAPSSHAAAVAVRTDSGDLVVHLLDRPVGHERFAVTTTDSGALLTASLDLTDRGSALRVDAELATRRDGTPTRFRAKGNSYRFVNVDIDVTVDGGGTRVRSLGDTATRVGPARVVFARGYAPLSGRGAVITYWEAHGRPARLDGLDGPVRVALRGADTLTILDRRVVLRRYDVDGVVWGHEAVWLDSASTVAAVITRVHILPLEAVRTEYVADLARLEASAVRDRIADVAAMGRAVPPVATGRFAIVGARLVDPARDAPIVDGTIVVADGRIAAVGPRATTPLPAGVRTFDARGLSVVPGLWDLHAHAAQVEWGPAYLAAGVTTARDMGGEAAFLTAMRDAWASASGPGPNFLLAGLIDGPGALGFGTHLAATPSDARALVDWYHGLGFGEIKLYNSVTAPVAGAAIARAHELGMVVAGHVPTAMGLRAIVDSGMDHVAHMPFRGDAGAARDSLIAEMKAHGTVLDPTLPWNEVLGRPSDLAPEAVEPMLARAPGPLRANYASVRNRTTRDAFAQARAAELRTVKAVFDAGVPVVAGTDGAVPGASVVRSIEEFVAAGWSPLDALRSATTVSARATRAPAGTATLSVGAPADLFVVAGDPLADIGALRRGRWTVRGGRLYETERLWVIAGFAP